MVVQGAEGKPSPYQFHQHDLLLDEEPGPFHAWDGNSESKPGNIRGVEDDFVDDFGFE